MTQIQHQGQGRAAMSELQGMLQEGQNGLSEVTNAHQTLTSRHHALTTSLSNWQRNLNDGRAALDCYGEKMAEEDRSIAQSLLERAQTQVDVYGTAVEKTSSALLSMTTMKDELTLGNKEINGMIHRLKTRDYLGQPAVDPNAAPLNIVNDERLDEIRQSIKKAHYFVRGLQEII